MIQEMIWDYVYYDTQFRTRCLSSVVVVLIFYYPVAALNALNNYLYIDTVGTVSYYILTTLITMLNVAIIVGVAC